MAGNQRNRYLVSLDMDESTQLLGGSWYSECDDDTAESLVLNPDGGFTHEVTSDQSDFRCHGNWSLSAVRFLGADLDLPISNLTDMFNEVVPLTASFFR